MHKHHIISLALISTWLVACSPNTLEEENRTLRAELEEARTRAAVLQEELEATTARSQQLYKDIVASILETHSILYRNIDYDKEKERAIRNIAAMQALYTPLIEGINSQEVTDPAFQAILLASGHRQLAGSATHAFGRAAAAGNQPSLDVLLNYAEHGLLLSTTVFSLQQAATEGNDQAIHFLIGVMNDDSSKALWNAASKGLAMAANQGNEGAKEAMRKYAEYEAQRRNQ